MYRFLVSLLLLTLPSISYGQTCDQTWSIEPCLQGLIILKCEQYSLSTVNLAYEEECDLAARDLVRILDLKPAGSNARDAIAFTEKLAALLADAAAQRYLADLKRALEKSFQDQSPFSLWDFTLAATGNDLDRGIEWLAVLLQDTSDDPPIRDYVRTRLSERIPAQAVSDWSDLLDMLSAEALARNRQVRVYPLPFDRYLNAHFYHYYPILYAARQLAALGHRRTVTSFVPFLFNAIYVFREIPSGHWPLIDPSRMPDGDPSWALQNLYAGYLGGLVGAGDLRGALKFDDFKALFAEDPRAAMRILYRRAVQADPVSPN